jgi:hypothetical protein
MKHNELTIPRVICMTKLLEQAIEKRNTRPINEQGLIVTLILEFFQNDDYIGFSTARYIDCA